MRAAVIAGQVFRNCQFIITDATENCFCVEFIFAPHLGLVTGYFLMTFVAGIIFIAAFEFNGDNVKGRMVMRTACVLINQSPFDNRR